MTNDTKEMLARIAEVRDALDRLEMAVRRFYFFEPLEKEISVEDMQKIVNANEKLVKELKDAKD